MVAGADDMQLIATVKVNYKSGMPDLINLVKVNENVWFNFVVVFFTNLFLGCYF